MKLKSVLTFILIFIIIMFLNPVLDTAISNSFVRFLAIAGIAAVLMIILEFIPFFKTKEVQFNTGIIIILVVVGISFFIEFLM